MPGNLGGAGSCQACGASHFPPGSPYDPPSSHPADGEFYLHPHYRAKLPIEATLLKVQAGADNFITEKYADQIAAILNEWSAALQKGPTEKRSRSRRCCPQFFGLFVRATESRLIRPGPSLEIRHNKFADQTILRREAFLQSVKSAMSAFSKIINRRIPGSGD